jgi:hypothetical protein
MTPVQFRNAMRKGLGRAIVYLMEHETEPFYDEIAYCCTHNTAYDPQCEGTRAQYVFEVLRLTGETERFRSQVLEALLAASHWRDAVYLFELAGLMAEHGDEKARQTIYEKLERNDTDSDSSFMGREVIIRLDGLEGFLRIAELIGAAVLSDPEHQDHGEASDTLRSAKTLCGEDRAVRAIEEAARTNERIAAYSRKVEEHERSSPYERSYRVRFRDFRYDRVAKEIESRKGNLSIGILRSWGLRASDEDLARAADDLLAETRHEYLLSYVRIFDGRRFPLDPQRLMDLARSDDRDMSWAALKALWHVDHPGLRDLAMELLEKRICDGVLGLVAHNYSEGDHARIEAVLCENWNEEQVHSVGYDLREVFEENETPDCQRLMLWVYEHTPCALCRHHAVRILLTNEVAPAWMIRECCYDSDEETRALAKGRLGR